MIDVLFRILVTIACMFFFVAGFIVLPDFVRDIIVGVGLISLVVYMFYLLIN